MNNLLYSVEREYPVAVETLWNAWVEADALEDWYHPTDLAVLPGSVTSDATVGGWWTVSVTHCPLTTKLVGQASLVGNLLHPLWRPPVCVAE